MGYEVYVTRAECRRQPEPNPISIEEWKHLVENDAEMRLENEATATGSGDVLKYENDGLAIWVGYSAHSQAGKTAWFDHRDGQVVVKNPDEEILAKLRAIAEKLNARVLGEEGELY